MIRTTVHCDWCFLPFIEGYGQDLTGAFVPVTTGTPFGVLVSAFQCKIHSCCRAHGEQICATQTPVAHITVGPLDVVKLGKLKLATVNRFSDCPVCFTRSHSGPCNISGKSAASGERPDPKDYPMIPCRCKPVNGEHVFPCDYADMPVHEMNCQCQGCELMSAE